MREPRSLTDGLAGCGYYYPVRARQFVHLLVCTSIVCIVYLYCVVHKI